MKNKIKNHSILITFIIMLIIIIGLIIGNIFLQKESDWKKFSYDLFYEIIKAIVISLCLGVIIHFISANLFSVELNMKKLRECGIEGIGTGISTQKDIKQMFGSIGGRQVTPSVMKLMFITGNGFLKQFQDKIIRCLNDGCKIQLLIMSPEKENVSYLKRVSKLYANGKIDLEKELKEDTMKTIEEIRKFSNGENLKVRFYKDEFQNNIRISKYINSKDEEISYYWINLQPFNQWAIDLSVSFKGKISSNQTEFTQENNIFLSMEEGFDRLWNLYDYTEQ